MQAQQVRSRDCRLDRAHRLPRIWSNQELARIAHIFTGKIVNVSAGDDLDKQGRSYRDYFLNADSYEITNFGGTTYRGFEGREGEIELDLEGEVPCQLLNAYDIAFNHTTLEHIFDVRKAFTNLCKISNDIVIIVVPFCQVHHETSGYKDFWRFSPTSLRELFKREGLSVVMESYSSIFYASVYIFMVASRMPDRWRSSFPARALTAPCGEWIGKAVTLSQVTQILIIYARQKLRSLRLWLLSL